jgi:site-specific recombinase XerD
LKIVKEAATKAGIRKTITPHVLRHSSIRIWSRFKTNTSIIRDSSIKTTEIYTHVATNTFKTIKIS